jgi:hypothetical protein
MAGLRYEDCVFLNVPFDRRYEGLLRALVFTVHDCGFVARCAREVDDSGHIRLDKIYALISQSKYGIHDLSRTGLDRRYRLPRFNMPLELGIFLGAARFGAAKQQKKRCLILDRDRSRYQIFCSDIAGHDIQPHADRIEEVIRGVRNWLSSDLTGQGVQIPGGSKMVARYDEFRRRLPDLCHELKLSPRELIYNEYANLVVGWLRANPW